MILCTLKSPYLLFTVCVIILERLKRTLLVLVGLFACGLPAGSAWSRPPLLEARPADAEVVRLYPESVHQRDGVTREGLSFSFAAFSKLFEFDLQESPPFLPGARTVWVTPDGRRLEQPSPWSYWSGRLRGRPDSAVRLRTRGAAVEGLIRDGGEIYLLEPAFGGEVPPGTVQAAVYRLDERDFLFDHESCGVRPHDEVEEPLDSWRQASGAAPRSQGKTLREVEIRLLLDSLYFQRHGMAAADRVHVLVHQLNGLFEKEMGLTFRITETEVSTSPGQDAVNGSTDARILLEQLGQSDALRGADMVHLFTGRELDAETLGIAWIGGACRPDRAYSLTQDLGNAAARFVALAHEAAHVLGARHDGLGYCGRINRGWIMWPVLDPTAVSFSSCSRELVSLYLDRFSCVSALTPEPLPAPEPRGASGSRPIRLRWSQVPGAEAYQVEVFDEVAGRTIYSETVAATEVVPQADFRAGQRYRWRVVGVNSAGLGQRSPWDSFTVSRWVVR